jgi:hypothetical protein
MAKKTITNVVIESVTNYTCSTNDVSIVFKGTKAECRKWVKDNAEDLGLGNNEFIGEFDINDPDTWATYDDSGNNGEQVTTYTIAKI